MSDTSEKQLDQAISRDPYLHSKELEYLRNFLETPQAKTDTSFFQFMLRLLPEKLVFHSLGELYGYNEKMNSCIGTLPDKLCHDWQINNGYPAFRSVLFNIIDEVRNRFDKAIESLFRERIDEVKKLFRLERSTIECLQVIYLLAEDADFEMTLLHPTRGERNKTMLIARLLWPYGLSVSKCKRIGGHLRKLGIIDAEYRLVDHIREYLSGMSENALSSAFFHCSREKTLPLSWFVQTGSTVTFMRDLIEAHTAGCPLHILFYGAAGTGKTELARSLASACGRDLFEIKQYRRHDSRSDMDSFSFRLSAIHACSNAVDSGHSVVLIDEADDMLNPGLEDNSKKGAINDIIDQTSMVCIWIVNRFKSIHPSTRRRFDYSKEFGELSVKERQVIWRYRLSNVGLENQISETAVANLAHTYRVNAGAIAFAVENTTRLSTLKDPKATLEHFLEQHIRLMEDGRKRQTPQLPEQYTVEGLNIQGEISANECVGMLSKFCELQHSDSRESDPQTPRNITLLMSGPPGTGKTAFAKYIAIQLNRQVIIKTAGDILSCWKGETENNIREAFKEAEREEAVLFFDEVESLLSTRTLDARRWEVTEVNEFLSCMENFHGIFLAATNFRERLDPAAIRRFNFKYTFDYLTAEGKSVFWNRYLKPLTGKNLDREERFALHEISPLTPGDFQRVLEKSAMLEEHNWSNGDLIQALRDEAADKEASGVNPIGFRHKTSSAKAHSEI